MASSTWHVDGAIWVVGIWLLIHNWYSLYNLCIWLIYISSPAILLSTPEHDTKGNSNINQTIIPKPTFYCLYFRSRNCWFLNNYLNRSTLWSIITYMQKIEIPPHMWPVWLSTITFHPRFRKKLKKKNYSRKIVFQIC